MARILVVCQHYWPENFRINDLCEGFVERGHEVDVLCGQPNYPKGEWFEGYGPFKRRKEVHNGVNIRRTFEIRRGKNTNIRIFLNYISFPMASLTHIPHLLGKKYDKIFLYQISPVMMSLAGIILGKMKKIDTTMYVLDIWPQNLYSVLPIKNKFLKIIALKVSMWHYKNVSKIVTVSNRLKEYFEENLDIKPENICFIPQCCEKLYEQDIEDLQLKDRFKNGFNIVFTGNISPAQSFETILDAAVLLKEEGLENIRYIIVGDGMSKSWLEAEVRSRNLSNEFYFEGFHPMSEIPKYTHIADALIGCLSKSELKDFSIPAKVMSYMAAGRPLLLAMDGEVSSIIYDAKCGYVSPAGDAKALSENIRKLYDLNNDQRKLMGDNGRKYHLANFARDYNLDRMLEFILGDK